MGLFSSDIIEKEVNEQRKLQFMIDIEEHIKRYKDDFIHDHFNDRDKILFHVLDQWVRTAATRLNLRTTNQEENEVSKESCAGRYRYIKDELYIVVKLEDGMDQQIRQSYSKLGDKFWELHDQMMDEIHRTCETPGELILIYDKDMNLIKEKMNDGFIW